MPRLSQSDPAIQNRVASLVYSASNAFVESMEANKTGVVAMFPFVFRAIVSRLLWPCLLKIGSYVVGAMVRAMLTRLGKMTIKDAVELILSFQATPPKSADRMD